MSIQIRGQMPAIISGEIASFIIDVLLLRPPSPPPSTAPGASRTFPVVLAAVGFDLDSEPICTFRNGVDEVREYITSNILLRHANEY